METIYRTLLWTLVFCHYTWSLEENCNNKLGIGSKIIPDESITASSASADHSPSFARLDGARAWCSAPEDKSPYIQIKLDEQKLITAITTQGSFSDLSWSRKYEVKYLEKGNWKSYKEELKGNRNAAALNINKLDPVIRTHLIRVYPKEPFTVSSDATGPIPSCLRLELHGCSAPADCVDPGSPLNGLRRKDHFGHVKQISFACLKGFVLIGSATSTCRDGTWTHALPRCKATCEDPGVPENGRRKGDIFIDGVSVKFTCDENYSLIGSPTIRCLEGRWSSASPECKASCKDPGSPRNGVRHGNEFVHNKRISFTCLPGFQMTGSPTAVCTSGKWSASIPQCKAICLDPGVPVNGKRIGNSFLDGQTVAFRCQPGHMLTGSQVIRCVAGKWNDDTPECKASCKDPVLPLHGRIVDPKSRSQHGEQVTFGCESGFKLKGPSTITCNNGIWNSSSPLCIDYDECSEGLSDCDAKASCTNTVGSFTCACNKGSVGDGKTCFENCRDPGILRNGARKGDKFEHGQTVSFTCNNGYTLIGSNSTQCRKGVWSPSLPRCKKSCIDPGAPQNGLRTGNDFRHGKKVTFSCKSTFKLTGVSSITCLDGTWSNKVPECSASCRNPGILRNGARNGDNFEHGQTVSFTCNSGFRLIGSNSMQCRNGVWSSSIPQCKKSCSNPGAPQKGFRIGNDFRHGKKVTFSCQSTFKLTGVSSITCLDGTWSHKVPECSASCRNPGIPRNGARNGDNFEHGQTVRFTCNNGYTLIGSNWRQCRNGVWSSSLPQCKKSCSNPGAPQKGFRIGNDFRHGKKVTFRCQSTFKLTGVSSIACLDGTWSHKVPECSASCRNPGIPRNGARNGDNFEHGQTVSFTCNNGYTLIGRNLIHCRKGVWSPSLPRCKKSCIDPGAPQNGFRTGNDFRHGKKVTFRCQSTFKLTGVSSITCLDGTWSHKVPECSASCRNPGFPRNGARNGDNFEHGQTVRFTCNNGYTLIGSNSRQCRNGVWSSSLPQCKKSCSNPGAPQKGFRIGNDFRHGKKVTFRCQSSFKLTGVSSITCLDGAWSHKVPECSASCRNPGIPRNGARNGDNFQHGQTVRFTCNNGYTLIGSNSMQCRNGVWSSSLPQCKKSCSNPGAPQKGFRIGNDFRHGKKVTFSCQSTFKLTGVSSIACLDGTWSNKVPECSASCRNPGIPRNGARNGNNFEHGQTVRFTCNNGYTLIGSNSRQCRNGVWSSSLPQCKKPSSCKNLGLSGRRSGVYQLSLPGYGEASVYCHMGYLGACGGGGWTLVMKTDGTKGTFTYGSQYWTNRVPYNILGGVTGLDSRETKLPTYWTTPFKKICLGMKIDGQDTRFIVINKAADSLYSLIADGKHRATSLGRHTWKKLIGSQASLQLNCNKEGFNLHTDRRGHNRARIGILANQEKHCKNPDSRIGFGTEGYPGHGNTCGNAANRRYRPDNGGKNIRAMGYIFVQ